MLTQYFSQDQDEQDNEQDNTGNGNSFDEGDEEQEEEEDGEDQDQDEDASPYDPNADEEGGEQGEGEGQEELDESGIFPQLKLLLLFVWLIAGALKILKSEIIVGYSSLNFSLSLLFIIKLHREWLASPVRRLRQPHQCHWHAGEIPFPQEIKQGQPQGHQGGRSEPPQAAPDRLWYVHNDMFVSY